MILETHSLVLSKGENRTILNDISIRFSSPEFTVLSGPNGSGKSMLLRVLIGLEKPSSGSVSLDGQDFPRAFHSLGDKVGMVFQHPHTQILGQTVEEDVLLGLRIHEKNKKIRIKRCQEILEWAGLQDHLHQSPETLSGGELRRLALASVLALDPDFVLFDEPFNGLDYPGVQSVLRAMVELHEKGKGIILVTHHLDQVLAHTDRLIVLKDGRIMADGIPQRILPHLEDHGVRKPSGKILEMSWL